MKLLFRNQLFSEILNPNSSTEAEIPVDEPGFDDNHLRFMANICNYSRPQVAKLLRGPTAKKFFEHFPELKRPKNEGGLFWNSGLWNPSYYIGSPRNIQKTIDYIKRQKYGEKGIGKAKIINFINILNIPFHIDR